MCPPGDASGLADFMTHIEPPGDASGLADFMTHIEPDVQYTNGRHMFASKFRSYIRRI
ncbi:hypothetical protein DPMN_183229 [Dreissena polymorpha]|uniref:Uncharacterized protein n=1 Tax=Dreissena polymorpha TaxID=45954 RepID=A0A9D4DIN3_DREPO|nr:hypothetical protein DPMN_183229 [Dreissena polymorpha]